MRTLADGTIEIGVGLVSVGWMGQLHSRAYTNLRFAYADLGIRPRLVHAADPAPDRAEEAVRVYGYERASADYHEVLNDPEVDVVSICAPNFLHAEIGIAAAQAGKHFWIEKPVGRGEHETRAVAEAAAAAGVVSSIGFNYRHAPAIEYLRELVLDGTLGRITNVRGQMFADYSSDPRGALSWRFIRGLAGNGVLGDLMGHLVDLVQYTLGPIAEVSAVTSTVYAERPELPMGTGTHFALIEGGTMKPVENEDYAGMLIRIAGDAPAAHAVGTLEASRVSVGPRASYGIEVYGTAGSAHWDFERMNELHLSGGLGAENQGYTRVMARSGMGDFGRFQPGAGTSMGYDDLKVIEAKKFLQAVVGREALNSNIQDALSAAQVVTAAERSAQSRAWEQSSPVPGTTAAGANTPGAAAPAPRIASAPINWGVIEVPGWGLQLPRERVLNEMVALGITATEFGPEGFLPDGPAERAAALAAAGLRAVGGFFPVVLHRAEQDPLPAIERELAAYVAAGAGTLVLSAVTGGEGYDGGGELTDAEWATLLTNLDRALDAAAAVGVVATLHPHVGTVVEAPAAVERVVAGSRIGLCLDTGHYTLGGGDPVAFVKRHAARIVHAHLKDVSLDVAARVRAGEIDYREGVRQGMYQPLGAGDARLAEIVAALRDADYSGWYVLEQDTVVESEADAAVALENARRSVAFIRDALAGAGAGSEILAGVRA